MSVGTSIYNQLLRLVPDLLEREENERYVTAEGDLKVHVYDKQDQCLLVYMEEVPQPEHFNVPYQGMEIEIDLTRKTGTALCWHDRHSAWYGTEGNEQEEFDFALATWIKSVIERHKIDPGSNHPLNRGIQL